MRRLLALVMAVPALSCGEVGSPEASVQVSIGTAQLDCAGTASLTVTTENFDLVAFPGEVTEGQGHYHVYLDTATGGNYLVAEHLGLVNVRLPVSISEGEHGLRVQLMHSDHSP